MPKVMGTPRSNGRCQKYYAPPEIIIMAEVIGAPEIIGAPRSNGRCHNYCAPSEEMGAFRSDGRLQKRWAPPEVMNAFISNQLWSSNRRPRASPDLIFSTMVKNRMKFYQKSFILVHLRSLELKIFFNHGEDYLFRIIKKIGQKEFDLWHLRG